MNTHIVSFIFGGAFIWTGFLSAGAEAISSTTHPLVIPNEYVNYQRLGMTAQDLQFVSNATPAEIDKLLVELHKLVPPDSDWFKYGAVDANPNKTSARKLYLLADNGVRFSKEQIDVLLRGLDNPEAGVVQDVRTAMVQIFGISFVKGEDWIYKPEEIRRPYKEAWKKFWRQNRDRYGQNLPLVINDLCINAQMLTNSGSPSVAITITNYGDADWKIHAEVSGHLTGKPDEIELPIWPITLYIDGRGEAPIIPAAYSARWNPRRLTQSEFANLPDRPVHLDRVTIHAGESYFYVMKLGEAFPQLNNPRYTNLVVRYSYGLYGNNKDEPVWRGELRSQSISIGLHVEQASHSATSGASKTNQLPSALRK